MGKTKESILSSLRSAPENYMYICLTAAEASALTSKIAQKRKWQLQSLGNLVANTGLTATEATNTIHTAFQAKFGMTLKAGIKRMIAGYDLYVTGGVAGIGNVPELEVCEIDTETGFPLFVVAGIGDTDTSTLTEKPTTIGDYSSTGSIETGQITAVYNNQTGKQVAKLNKKTGKFENGVSTDGDQNNVWSKVLQLMPFIVTFLEWLGTLFGGKKTTELSATQDDGWWCAGGTNNTTGSGLLSAASGWILPLVAIGLVFSLKGGANKGNNKNKKKR